jgi:hypothetical protein
MPRWGKSSSLPPASSRPIPVHFAANSLVLAWKRFHWESRIAILQLHAWLNPIQGTNLGRYPPRNPAAVEELNVDAPVVARTLERKKKWHAVSIDE